MGVLGRGGSSFSVRGREFVCQVGMQSLLGLTFETASMVTSGDRDMLLGCTLETASLVTYLGQGHAAWVRLRLVGRGPFGLSSHWVCMLPRVYDHQKACPTKTCFCFKNPCFVFGGRSRVGAWEKQLASSRGQTKP